MSSGPSGGPVSSGLAGFPTSVVGGPHAIAVEDEQAPATADPTSRAAAILRHVADEVRIRPMTELDIDGITRIDERITRKYRPEDWEQRVGYYFRRDADTSKAAEVNGSVTRFLGGEVRSGRLVL